MIARPMIFVMALGVAALKALACNDQTNFGRLEISMVNVKLYGLLKAEG